MIEASPASVVLSCARAGRVLASRTKVKDNIVKAMPATSRLSYGKLYLDSLTVSGLADQIRRSKYATFLLPNICQLEICICRRQQIPRGILRRCCEHADQAMFQLQLTCTPLISSITSTPNGNNPDYRYSRTFR